MSVVQEQLWCHCECGRTRYETDAGEMLINCAIRQHSLYLGKSSSPLYSSHRGKWNAFRANVKGVEREMWTDCNWSGVQGRYIIKQWILFASRSYQCYHWNRLSMYLCNSDFSTHFQRLWFLVYVLSVGRTPFFSFLPRWLCWTLKPLALPIPLFGCRSLAFSGSRHYVHIFAFRGCNNVPFTAHSK